MNAPYFNMKNLPNESWGSSKWINAMLAEQERCTGGIDARLDKLEGEWQELHYELSALEKQSASEFGIFANISLYFKMRKVARQMEWRRKVILELLRARIARTFCD